MLWEYLGFHGESTSRSCTDSVVCYFVWKLLEIVFNILSFPVLMFLVEKKIIFTILDICFVGAISTKIEFVSHVISL